MVAGEIWSVTIAGVTTVSEWKQFPNSTLFWHNSSFWKLFLQNNFWFILKWDCFTLKWTKKLWGLRNCYHSETVVWWFATVCFAQFLEWLFAQNLNFFQTDLTEIFHNCVIVLYPSGFQVANKSDKRRKFYDQKTCFPMLNDHSQVAEGHKCLKIFF